MARKQKNKKTFHPPILIDSAPLLKSLQKKCNRRATTLESKEKELRHMLDVCAPMYETWFFTTFSPLLSEIRSKTSELETLTRQWCDALERSFFSNKSTSQCFEENKACDQGEAEIYELRQKFFEKSEEEQQAEPLPKWTDAMRAYIDAIYRGSFYSSPINSKKNQEENALFNEAFLHFLFQKPIPEAASKVWNAYKKRNRLDEEDPENFQEEDYFRSSETGQEDGFFQEQPSQARQTETTLDTTLQHLKKLYRSLSRALHPDLNPDQPEAHKRLWHQVQEAYRFGSVETLQTLELRLKEEEPSFENITQISLLSSLLSRMDTRLRRVRTEFRKVATKPFFEFDSLTKQALKKLEKKIESDLRHQLASVRSDLKEIKDDIKLHERPPSRQKGWYPKDQPNSRRASSQDSKAGHWRHDF
jgi:hypothetical protein